MIAALQQLGQVTLRVFQRLGRGSLFLLQTLSNIPGVLLRPGLVVKQLYSGFEGHPRVSLVAMSGEST